MSDIIKLLPDNIANQIAAGEVVQRPASVVKELVENSIDSGANKIQIVIKDAGRTLIQVIDNGCGMSRNDALQCFERHATSKVQTVDDLFSLTTKGFRGEALASIASIAHVTLKTKQKDHELGTKVEIEGNKLLGNEPCTCSNGTSIEVKNLFFNVPARRNFLKSDSVEFNHILDEFERISLAHSDLQFELHHNNQEIFQLHPGILRKRIIEIIGKQANDKLVPVEEQTAIVSITGYIGKPEFAKKNRGEQFLFVNNRYFKDNYFQHALMKGYDGMLTPKMFPSYFIFLTVDPKKIDVNVHPTKTEIKFEEDRSIYAIIMSSVRQALGKYNISPTLDFDREGTFDLPLEMKNSPIVEPKISVNPNYNPFSSNLTKDQNGSKTTSVKGSALNAQGFGNKNISPEDWKDFYQIKEFEDEPHQATIELEIPEKRDYLIKDNYLFASIKSGLMIIHLKRAKERIIYDKLMSQFVSEPIHSQQLLFPIEKSLSNKEKNAWQMNEALFNRLGFFGNLKNEGLAIVAVPSILAENTIMDCVDHLFSELDHQEIDKGELAHFIAVHISASASISLSTEAKGFADSIIEQLFQCAEHIYSPRGKKILETLSIEMLTSNF